ncbi:MAG: hypothetical protein ACRC4V_14215, partial [Aeromonas veronii]
PQQGARLTIDPKGDIFNTYLKHLFNRSRVKALHHKTGKREAPCGASDRCEFVINWPVQAGCDTG